MQIVIDIPKKAYELLQNDGVDWLGAEHILDAVANGTPLPKGHGRLIDSDSLPLHAIDDANYGSNYIKNASTIIEADKESEE